MLAGERDSEALRVGQEDLRLGLVLLAVGHGQHWDRRPDHALAA